VRTNAIQRKEFVADMKQRDNAAANNELAPFANGHV
jgi:hypothetical protein